MLLMTQRRRRKRHCCAIAIWNKSGVYCSTLLCSNYSCANKQETHREKTKLVVSNIYREVTEPLNAISQKQNGFSKDQERQGRGSVSL